MSTTDPSGGTSRTVHREYVKPGIWKRRNADGTEVFEIKFRDSAGVSRRRTIPGKISAADRALTAEKARRDRGERAPDDPHLRFPKAADAWWQARVVKLRPATQNAYCAALAHLRESEHIGNRKLSDVTPAAVARFVSAQQATGFKGWTVKGNLTVLSGVFSYAARHLGHVGGNPVAALDRVERPSTEDSKPARILTPAELERLLAAVDEPGPQERAQRKSFGLIFATAAETGGRLGEILGLAWGDIDLEAETVRFEYQLDRHGKRVRLKTTRSRRCIEVTPALVRRLRTHKLASPYSGPHDLVFATATGSGHDHRNIGGRVLARAVKRAGLGAVERDGIVVEPAPTFHSLRHSHASALIAAGWDVVEVSSRLGHSSVEITLRIYAHEFDATRRSGERRDRLAALYGGPECGPAVAPQDGSTAQQANGSEPVILSEHRA